MKFSEKRDGETQGEAVNLALTDFLQNCFLVHVPKNKETLP